MFFWDNKYAGNLLKEPKIILLLFIESEVEVDKKEEKDKTSVKTAHNLVDKSYELFDCSPLKNVKPDRTLQTVKGR